MRFLEIAVVLLLLGHGLMTEASDHLDGNVTTSCYNGYSDINDFYNFTTPDGKRVVFILTVGDSKADGSQHHFPHQLVLQFRSRATQVKLEDRQLAVNTDIFENEDKITCQFSPLFHKDGKQEQSYICGLNCHDNSDCVKNTGWVNKLSKRDTPMKVYAGKMKDPFISAPLFNRLKRPRAHKLDPKRDLSLISRKVLTRNFIAGRNILGLVVEVDKTLLKGVQSSFGKGVIGSIAETLTTEGECR